MEYTKLKINNVFTDVPRETCTFFVFKFALHPVHLGTRQNNRGPKTIYFYIPNI